MVFIFDRSTVNPLLECSWFTASASLESVVSVDRDKIVLSLGRYTTKFSTQNFLTPENIPRPRTPFKIPSRSTTKNFDFDLSRVGVKKDR